MSVQLSNSGAVLLAEGTGLMIASWALVGDLGPSTLLLMDVDVVVVGAVVAVSPSECQAALL